MPELEDLPYDLRLVLAGHGSECVRLLVDAGANVHLRDNLGRTPLDMLTKSNIEGILQAQAQAREAEKSRFAKEYAAALQDSIAVLRRAEQAAVAEA